MLVAPILATMLVAPILATMLVAPILATVLVAPILAPSLATVRVRRQVAPQVGAVRGCDVLVHRTSGQAIGSIPAEPRRIAGRRLGDGHARPAHRRQPAPRCQPAIGSRTMKRAPTTRPAASRRFSALMRPFSASTICRLIDRPRPECLPNCSFAGRSE